VSYVDELMRVARGEQDVSAEAVQAAAKEEREQRMVTRRVSPQVPKGPIKFAFIGERPGKWALTAGTPFVGHEGDELRHWCAAAGINLRECYLDYVYPFEGDVDEEGKATAQCLFLDRITNVLLKQTTPCVVLTLGDEALKTNKALSDALKRRGSVYPTVSDYLMPLLDPTKVAKKTQWRRRCILDLQEAVRIAEEGWHAPQFMHRLVLLDDRENPADRLAYDLECFRELGNLPGLRLAIDIETAALDDRITCVSFCWGDDASLVYQWPQDDNDNRVKSQLIRETIKMFCESPCQKVLHNGLYDAWWLKRYAGIDLVNWKLDTMGMAQVVCPTDNISLEYMTSLLPGRPIPYYKDEGKDHFQRAPKDEAGWRQLMTYCGQDAIATLRVYEMLSEQTEAMDLWDFYNENYPPKFAPMLDLMLQGVWIDQVKQAQARDQFLLESRTARDALTSYNDGEPLFTLMTKRDQLVYEAFQRDACIAPIAKTAKTIYTLDEIQKSLDVIHSKTVSQAKLKTLLYEKLGLPQQLKRRAGGEETPTSDNLTLRKLKLEHPENQKAQEVIDLAIKSSKAHKLAEFCYESKNDHDGRFRYSLKFTTETGRFASSKAPNGRGGNSQNVPHIQELRSQFLPDPGHVILAVDMSAIEARICFLYTRDPELVRLAQARPSEYDQHSENAVLLGLATDVKNVPYQARQLAKKIVHGAQRNMQAQTLQDNLLKDADLEKEVILPTLEQCEGYLETYHQRVPAIRGVFFEETRRRMQTKRWLVNSWGRRWGLPHEDLNEEAMRRAFSFYLQSEGADLINRQGFVPMWEWLRAEQRRARILLHIHDELVFSCPPTDVWQVAGAIQRLIEAPHRICGVDFVAPIEYGVGATWAVTKEWKELPSRDEMTEYAISCGEECA